MSGIIQLVERIDGPRGGVNWAFFQILKQDKATLTYAKLDRVNFQVMIQHMTLSVILIVTAEM
jgi:hypothetical protein